MAVAAGIVAACNDGEPSPQCSCGAGNAQATIHVACGTVATYSAESDADCSLGQSSPGTLDVESAFPGTCRVLVTLSNGATLSTDVTFTPVWEPCGSDPHGCGQGVTVSPQEIELGVCGDAGSDGGG
ncbi:MAG TPA: hypothetical protein VIY73_25490 [Polyangiaceae bacterium]